MDIKTFSATFGTEEACVEYLARKRWPHGPACDKCGVVNDALKTARSRYWSCRACGNMFSVTHGTPFEHTRLPLVKWFLAIVLIATSSKGVSSMLICRQLAISYKSAWLLTHRIRALLGEDDALLRGVLEVDETYLGGRRRRDAKSRRDDDDQQPRGRGGSRRLVVITATERNGKAKARKGKTHGRSISRAVFDWVDPNATLASDELPAYRRIGRRFPAHLRVNHSAGEWPRRDPPAIACAHSNTVEAFNAMIKRSILGVWHRFSVKHADRYLREVSMRWNVRGGTSLERFKSMFGTTAGIGPLNWKALTA